MMRTRALPGAQRLRPPGRLHKLRYLGFYTMDHLAGMFGVHGLDTDTVQHSRVQHYYGVSG